jgi:hypothetical protein
VHREVDEPSLWATAATTSPGGSPIPCRSAVVHQRLGNRPLWRVEGFVAFRETFSANQALFA